MYCRLGHPNSSSSSSSSCSDDGGDSDDADDESSEADSDIGDDPSRAPGGGGVGVVSGRGMSANEEVAKTNAFGFGKRQASVSQFLLGLDGDGGAQSQTHIRKPAGLQIVAPATIHNMQNSMYF